MKSVIIRVEETGKIGYADRLKREAATKNLTESFCTPIQVCYSFVKAIMGLDV